ncbi:MAG: hypothetical protein RLZZ136_1147 [Pseudomonadota bacterium]
MTKDVKPVRYAYSITSALLLGGAALSLVTGIPAGAQVAQNDQSQMGQITPRAGAPASFADLTAQLQPAVVGIATRQKVKVAAANPFAGTPFEGMVPDAGPQTREAGALGSGFIISADGYVVTNNHVITMDNTGLAESITVKLSDGNEYKARIVGHDQASDLAVLKIDRAQPFPFVTFGQSAKARAGDWIIAIGNPFGLGGSVTSGIISSVYRNTGSGAYDHYIQTDASINSGNSGGPMFDMAGNVIGINNWIIAPSGGNIGIGFAIPSDTAKPIVDKLMAGKAIERGYLGVTIAPVTDEVADALGIDHDHGELVQAVQPEGGAAKAGLESGDIIIKVAGIAVTPDHTLSGIVGDTAPGTRIPIELIRKGKRLTVNALVGKRPSDEELALLNFGQPQGKGAPDPFNRAKPQNAGLIEKSLGFSATPVTPQIARQLGVADNTNGLVITQVDASSDAAAKGLERRVIVLAANYVPVNTVAALEGVVRAAQAANRPAMLLQVMVPGRSPVFITIRLR